MKKEKGEKVTCPNCGASFWADPDKDRVECPYCGSSLSVAQLFGESEEEHRRPREEFRKGKFRKVLIVFIVFALIILLVKISSGQAGGIVLSLLALVLLVAAYLMGNRTIGGSYAKFYLIPAIAGILVCCISPMAGRSSGSSQAEKISWDRDIVLAQKLPEPSSSKAEILSNDSEILSVSIGEYSATDYDDYKKACQEMGYTVEASDNGSSFQAFGEEGYSLWLSYDDSESEMQIDLNAPEKLGELNWPQSTAAKLIPAPDTKTGNVETDEDDELAVRAGGMDRDAYDAYVQACSDKGFKVNYEKLDGSYSADDDKGNHLELSYLGNSVVSIDVKTKSKVDEENAEYAELTETESETETAAESAAETEIETQAETETKTSQETRTTQSSTSNTSGVSPDFKEAMDSYEEMIDGYVDFMEKYENSDDTLSMTKDYLEWTAKYEDAMNKLDAIDEDSLSDADESYYIEVMARIEQKLISLQ